MTKRKFYKTIISVEVLSEEPLSESMSLSDIQYAFTEGDCSAGGIKFEQTVLNGEQTAKALQKQGTDPEFFMLTNKGNDARY